MRVYREVVIELSVKAKVHDFVLKLGMYVAHSCPGRQKEAIFVGIICLTCPKSFGGYL